MNGLTSPQPKPTTPDWETQSPVTPTRPAKLPLFRPIEEGKPFPIDALPPVMRNAVVAIAESSQCEPAIAAGCVLAVASLAVQGHVNVTLPFGATVPTSLYLFTIAESGDRKSRADTLAMAAFTEAEEKANSAHKAGMISYLCAKDAWEASRAAILSKHKGDRAKLEAELKAHGEAPRPPLDPGFTVKEPTIAGLEKAFQTGRSALGLFSDEGGQMLGGHAFKEENKLRTVTGLNDLWTGSAIKRTRAGDGNSMLLGRRLSLHLMVQPSIAPQLLGDCQADGTGLLSRLLVAAPPSRPGTRLYREPRPECAVAIKCFSKVIGKLLERPWPHHPDDPQQLTPKALEMTRQAKQDWVVFHDQCQEAIRPEGEWSIIRPWGEKAPEHAARIAGVLALIDDPDCQAVEMLAMTRAIQLAQFYGNEMARLAGMKMLDPKAVQAEKLLQWLARKDMAVFALQQAYQSGPIRVAKEARDACDMLIEHGYLAPVPDGMILHGKRHKEAYRLIPD